MVASLVILDNFARFHGVTYEVEAAEAARQRLESAQAAFAERTAKANARLHKGDLALLLSAIEPNPDPRCTVGNRSRLRDAVARYVTDRAQAVALSKGRPELAEVESVWRTPVDDGALEDARDLITRGFLLPSDFDDWPETNNAVMTLPARVLSQCGGTIDAELEDERRQSRSGPGSQPWWPAPICGALNSADGATFAAKCRYR